MEIHSAQSHTPQYQLRDKGSKLAANDSTLQIANRAKEISENKDLENKSSKTEKTASNEVAHNKGIKLTLSSDALSKLNAEQKSNNKSVEQKQVDYKAEQEKYQKKVNELPSDYRKMKMMKDSLDEEIKKIKAEIRKIQQSRMLDEDKKAETIQGLDQQLADKSLAALEIRKEFTMKLQEQERSKQISAESAATMLQTFISTPPEQPSER